MWKNSLIHNTVLVFVLAWLPAAHAETLVQQNVDSRVVVTLRVAQAELQSWLPAPWQVNPVASGPAKDSNLTLVFIDRLLNLDGEGKPAAGGAERSLAVVAPAKNSKTDEIANYVIRIYTSNPQSTPGAYKNSTSATVQRDQVLKGTDIGAGVVSEAWTVQDASGGTVELRTQFQRGVPARSKPETKTRGGPDPEFYRIYRIDQGVDVVKSVPSGIDRTQNTQLRVTMAELRKLFDGSEQIVSMFSVPWYLRQVSLP
jgi:hypothetical protein